VELRVGRGANDFVALPTYLEGDRAALHR
jgi:hypothetical protein